jgi:hypothetical protein
LSISTPLSKKRKEKLETTQGGRKKRKSDFEMDDIVVPWNDIRGNFVITETKSKEIYTPEWRTPNSAMNGFDLKLFEEDEDEDQSICERHFPLEIQERKRYELVLQKDKKKHEEVKEKITEIYIQHDDATPSTPSVNPSTLEQTPVTPHDHNKIQSRLEKFNRSWTQVTKESYISEPVQDPKNGNYEVLKELFPLETHLEENSEFPKRGRGRGPRKNHYYDEGYTEDDLVFLPDDFEEEEEEEDDTFQAEPSPTITPKKRGRKKKKTTEEDDIFTFSPEEGSDFEIKEEEEEEETKKKKKRGRKKKIKYESLLKDPSAYYYGFQKNIKLEKEPNDTMEVEEEVEEEEEEEEEIVSYIQWEFSKFDEVNPLKIYLRQVVNTK